MTLEQAPRPTPANAAVVVFASLGALLALGLLLRWDVGLPFGPDLPDTVATPALASEFDVTAAAPSLGDGTRSNPPPAPASSGAPAASPAPRGPSHPIGTLADDGRAGDPSRGAVLSANEPQPELAPKTAHEPAAHMSSPTRDSHSPQPSRFQAPVQRASQIEPALLGSQAALSAGEQPRGPSARAAHPAEPQPQVSPPARAARPALPQAQATLPMQAARPALPQTPTALPVRAVRPAEPQPPATLPAQAAGPALPQSPATHAVQAARPALPQAPATLPTQAAAPAQAGLPARENKPQAVAPAQAEHAAREQPPAAAPTQAERATREPPRAAGLSQSEPPAHPPVLVQASAQPEPKPDAQQPQASRLGRSAPAPSLRLSDERRRPGAASGKLDATFDERGPRGAAPARKIYDEDPY
jgi:hypothetical protein